MQADTFIKICGLTRAQDVGAAVHAGAHFLGFVLYPGSPRYIPLERAIELCALMPPAVKPVLLFVNAERVDVQAACRAIPQGILQFHGDETPQQCNELADGYPYWRAARMRQGFNLKAFAEQYAQAQALVLDAHVQGYGGGGQAFDWSWVPQGLSTPLILSGGLNADNVGAGIRQIRPWGVDVSSGVEVAKGIKHHPAMQSFCQAVRCTDQLLST